MPTLSNYDRSLFAENKAVILLINPNDGMIVDASQGACLYYGYSLSELSAMSIYEINTFTKAEITTEMRHAKKESKNYFQFCHRLASGEIRDVEVYSNPVLLKDQKFLFSVIHDVTKRKLAEQQLRLAQKRDSLSSLAGGLTHELNNLLLPISALTGMALKKLPDDHSERGRLEKVAEAADRAKDIIAQLLAFSRTAEPKQENFDIATVVLDTLKLIRNTSPATIKIEEQVDADTGTVHADAAQIAIALTNMTSNALDAMDGKTGEMKVSLLRVQVDNQVAESIHGLESGIYAKLSI